MLCPLLRQPLLRMLLSLWLLPEQLPLLVMMPGPARRGRKLLERRYWVPASDIGNGDDG